MNRMADLDGRVSTDGPATMCVGPLGSTVHVLRADAETVTALAPSTGTAGSAASASTRWAGSSP